MPSSHKFDRLALDARSRILRDHPQFSVAKAEFCTVMPRCWLDNPLNRVLIGDTGAMGLALTITGLNKITGGNGISLQMLIDALTQARLASPARIRALVERLSSRNALVVTPHPIDRRRIVIAPSAVLFASLQVWFRSVMNPVAKLFSLPDTPDAIATMPGLAERYFTAVMLRQGHDGFTIFEGWPEAELFADRHMGYVLMLHLAGAAQSDLDVPRAQLADQYGVSPSQISTLIALAERQGWLKRHPRSSVVTLDASFADRLSLWVAREIAVVGMWLEDKLAIRPGNSG